MAHNKINKHLQDKPNGYTGSVYSAINSLGSSNSVKPSDNLSDGTGPFSSASSIEIYIYTFCT